ncbi:TetR/AcrR family transcriptional regulator [Kribbella monticola]|uniref:TetR/AcrR family transcriptional regulator n=1 Tax=Kribbella monticola TaxID=2185285 RepID=UPI000DD2DA00|nr:TetR/AcrR family transcriptional regulator [Kribbella monticola]
MGLREVKRERTRQLIADKAFELFTDRGFGRTTVEQIAAAAEVGPSTLYRYYPTKERLVLEFVEGSLFEALDWFREQPQLSLPDGLQGVVERVLDQMESNPDRVRTVYELAGQTPSVSAHLADVIWRWRDELTAELTTRLTADSSDQPLAGASVPFTAALAAGITMNVIEVTVQTWVDNPAGTDAKELAREAMCLLRGGGIPLPTADPTQL